MAFHNQLNCNGSFMEYDIKSEWILTSHVIEEKAAEGSGD